MQYHGVGRHHDQWPHAPTCGCEWAMTGQRYIHEVLLPHVCLFRGAVDLNPIENVRDALGRQVAGRNYPPTKKYTLIRVLTEELDKLPQQLLDNVVQKAELPVRLNSSVNKQRLVLGLIGIVSTPMRVEGDIEDVSSELDDGD
ncbi:hypothetical protein TNCV_2836321 [Trichonephila clavipes]|nr:hypothetical protein TNCV_2836321 [Trichonephila clavipes]